MGALLLLSSTLRIMSSEIDNNLSSSANNLSSSVILKEEFDEGFEPTKEGKCKHTKEENSGSLEFFHE